MTGLVEIPILAWAAWTEGADALAGEGLRPEAALPASLRRRVTPIGRRALEAAWAVLAGREGAAPRIVLSSRHGEYARTQGLLRGLAESGEVSPAEFSLAVHHGLAGLLSIATGNRAGHTAVAAGADTLGSALMEAAACLAEGAERVLLMHFDEALPPEYDGVGRAGEDGVALALLLGAGGRPLSLGWHPAQDGADGDVASALLGVLAGTALSARAGGDRMVWRLSRAA